MVRFLNGWDHAIALVPPDPLKFDFQKIGGSNVLGFEWLDFRSSLYWTSWVLKSKLPEVMKSLNVLKGI